MLAISPLSDVLEKISHSVCCLFILLMFLLLCKNFLVWWSPICLFFLLFPLPGGDTSNKTLLWARTRILLPMLSSRIFMASGLIFKSLIPFELIFVYGIRRWSSLIFLHVCVQCHHTIYWTTIFTQFYAPVLFVKSKLTIETWVYFWALYSVPLISMPVPCCFDYYDLRV